MAEMILFSGNANIKLAHSIATQLGVTLGQASVSRFSDGEIKIEILDNVRGKDVFILQSLCTPTNDHFMELILMSDAMRRASAQRITAVMPYFGYARQDRRARSARVPISAKVIADMLVTVDINRVLTVDLHSDQIQGFFDIPVDNAYCTPVMVEDIRKKDLTNLAIVSPDVGGVVRARAFARALLDSELVIIDKRRPDHNKAEVMNVIGEVADRNCVIVDDIVDTAGTLCKAATALKQRGARRVTAYCTHPILSGEAVISIANSELDELVVSDSVPIGNAANSCAKIRVVSIATMLSEAIRRVNNEESISCMFN